MPNFSLSRTRGASAPPPKDIKPGPRPVPRPLAASKQTPQAQTPLPPLPSPLPPSPSVPRAAQGSGFTLPDRFELPTRLSAQHSPRGMFFKGHERTTSTPERAHAQTRHSLPARPQRGSEEPKGRKSREGREARERRDSRSTIRAVPPDPAELVVPLPSHEARSIGPAFARREAARSVTPPSVPPTPPPYPPIPPIPSPSPPTQHPSSPLAPRTALQAQSPPPRLSGDNRHTSKRGNSRRHKNRPNDTPHPTPATRESHESSASSATEHTARTDITEGSDVTKGVKALGDMPDRPYDDGDDDRLHVFSASSWSLALRKGGGFKRVKNALRAIGIGRKRRPTISSPVLQDGMPRPSSAWDMPVSPVPPVPALPEGYGGGRGHEKWNGREGVGEGRDGPDGPDKRGGREGVRSLPLAEGKGQTLHLERITDERDKYPKRGREKHSAPPPSNGHANSNGHARSNGHAHSNGHAISNGHTNSNGRPTSNGHVSRPTNVSSDEAQPPAHFRTPTFGLLPRATTAPDRIHTLYSSSDVASAPLDRFESPPYSPHARSEVGVSRDGTRSTSGNHTVRRKPVPALEGGSEDSHSHGHGDERADFSLGAGPFGAFGSRGLMRTRSVPHRPGPGPGGRSLPPPPRKRQ